MKKIDYKVESGKLLRLDVEFKGELISEIKISGDFFIYPNSAICEIEAFLVNKNINHIEKLLDDFIKENGYRIIGFNSSDLKDAIYKTLD